jgi:hypothetical protein
MKNKITEEIKRSLLLMNYDCKKTLTEQVGINPPPGDDSVDVPKKPNWEEVKEYIMSKPDSVKGYWPENKPEYEYAKYENVNGNFMEAKSNGLAQEADSSFKVVHNGSWKWNGSEVIFSWLGTKRAGEVWGKAKGRLKTNGVEDYKLVSPKTGFDQASVKYSDGEWTEGGYNYAKLTQDINGSIFEIEIRDNFTWRIYSRIYNNVFASGKWSWDGSKIVFARGVTKKSSGPLSEEDTDLSTAIMVKNKIGKIGSKGEAVKQIQYEVTPSDSDNQYGTGDGCGDDPSKCTGIYDAKTKELVKTWQEENGLKADGLWGKESQRYKFKKTNSDEKEDESDID